ncbi:hypothetical protein GUITHDRAFT_105090 [Guillardia theta CCMP2712]|uniref:Uncharacterized protein n=1 Tax=Guillardia theta (strain CCMP2712) TaxID=905079 RepID=L1JKZ9_GUITC|nr:hypothetical protein GUITHDRAFT_105090 [Guillardia theta CCMP2712]EKX49007.1 hypothetical protein GUITHDRAFT_105090 [Guillardia theta CCMP2712]|eukprot:XP_005835987.1 hypothetical protein GUITHDRAFT_105090 [Guillardia theta CCMP2712]
MVQFSDARRIQKLTSTFTSEWPLTTITDDSSAEGNDGASWNYGDNFGGGASDYATKHDIFGSFGVTDSVYANGDIVLCTDSATSCSG